MITLAQAQTLTQDKLYLGVIDELKKDTLLDIMVFDNAAQLSGGSTLNYVYNKITKYSSAGFRSINKGYTDSETTTEPTTVALKILGGDYKIDRVIGKYVKGIVQQEAFQLEQKIKAIKRTFSWAFIRGNKSVDAEQYDGLEALISNKMRLDDNIDLSTAAKITKNYTALTDAFRDMEAEMGEAPTAWFCSPEGFALIQKIADRATGFTAVKDQFGKQTLYYNGTPFVKLGDISTTKNSVIETDAATGKTAFYPVRLALDGCHAISPEGNDAGISVYPIDPASSETVRKGSCEMVTGIALKNYRAAGKVSVQIKAVQTNTPPSTEEGGNNDGGEQAS